MTITGARTRGADIVAAVMKSPKTPRELCLKFGIRAEGAQLKRMRCWLEQFRAAGVMRVIGVRKVVTQNGPRLGGSVYAMQAAPFEAGDTPDEVVASN